MERTKRFNASDFGFDVASDHLHIQRRPLGVAVIVLTKVWHKWR
jgi:hypothetical protein